MILKPDSGFRVTARVLWEGPRGMDGQADSIAELPFVRAFPRRTADARDRRLADAMGLLLQGLAGLIRQTNASRADLMAVVGFLTEVGEACDDKRQEWVLLADVLGLTTAIECFNAPRPDGATPNTLTGPFYRPGAPVRAEGETISIDGLGAPLTFAARIADLDGQGIEGAVVEVWQANAQGMYENQEPDLQPEFNLRGTYRSGPGGRLTIRSVKPAGYAIPADGPVGRLMGRLGLGTMRPAHLHFRIHVAGFQTLTTHVFDRQDPAIDHDPLFAVHDALLVDFRPDGSGWAAEFLFVLARAIPAPPLT